MIGHRREIARLQSDFYRDQFRKILRWLLASVFIIFALMAVIMYLVFFEPIQKHYANTTDGKILAMPPAR